MDDARPTPDDGLAPVPVGLTVEIIEGPEGRRIRVARAPALSASGAPDESRRGSVLLLHGRSEFIEKYFETIADLQRRGLEVITLDWPGQGLSEKFPGAEDVGHVDRFETFVAAAQAVLGRFPPQGPLILLAHSMGCAAGLRALQTGALAPRAAAFIAPMWGFRVPAGAALLAWAGAMSGRAKQPFRPAEPAETFETNIVTRDRGRWTRTQAWLKADPRLALGPPSWGWINASYRLFRKMMRSAALKRVTTPILIATAGKERLVDNAKHAKAAARLPNAEHIVFDDAMHEILMERDAIRARFLEAFDRLLDRVGLPPPA